MFPSRQTLIRLGIILGSLFLFLMLIASLGAVLLARLIP
jgi:hypothetical protein